MFQAGRLAGIDQMTAPTARRASGWPWPWPLVDDECGQCLGGGAAAEGTEVPDLRPLLGAIVAMQAAAPPPVAAPGLVVVLGG